MTFEQRVEYFPGPFSVGPRKVYGALCEDGEQRTATCSEKGADTFFSIPARVSARGRTVSGFVTRDEDIWRFIAYRYGSNAKAILAHVRIGEPCGGARNHKPGEACDDCGLPRWVTPKTEDEIRTAPVCGTCGNRGYVTNPPGSDVSVEGVIVEPCPTCRTERSDRMHGNTLVSPEIRATIFAYFDRLVSEGVERADAYIKLGARFHLRSNQVQKLVLGREEARP